jgi:ELWxxDGT repeat protein
MKKIYFATMVLAICILSIDGQVMVRDNDPADKISSDPRNLFGVNGTLFFSSKGDYTSKAARGANSRDYDGGLWKSDGTKEGTQFVDVLYNPELMIGLNSSVYFIDDNRNERVSSRYGLWRYDAGSKPEGPRGMALITAIIPRSLSTSKKTLRVMDGNIFFVVFDQRERGGEIEYGGELWRSDGTAKGTASTGVKIKGAVNAFTLNLTVVNKTLYFCARDDTHGDELWKSDGTPGGTTMVKDINIVDTNTGDTLSSRPEDFVNVNGTLFFTADNGVHGRELWQSDGTEAGTVLVKDLRVGQPSSFSFPANITNVNGTAFFTADDGIHGLELWKSDGTPKGTLLVKDIGRKGWPSFPAALTRVNTTLFFTANDGIHGRELWKSNGSAQGTIMVKDINATPGSFPGTTVDSVMFIGDEPSPSLTDVNGILYLAANDGIHGFELWRSDGTAAGTLMVKDIKPFGKFGSDPKDLTNVNGVLFFTADDGPHGRELWKYDVSAK